MPWVAGRWAGFRTDGQTDSQSDRREEANSSFSQFRERAQRKNSQLSLHISFVFKVAILRSRATSIMQFTSTVCHQPGIVSILFKFEFILARNLSFWGKKFKIIAPFLEVYFLV